MPSHTGLLVVLLLALTGGVVTESARANGEIGDHVNNLKAHLDEYTTEVETLVGNVDGLVASYAEKGKSGVDTRQLIDWWEEVKFHGAIETHHVPLYASIWQGLYGVKEAIEQGKPVAQVRQRQQALERALWQALGAVKMAAVKQRENNAANVAETGTDTIKDILDNLEHVASLHAAGEMEKARELVHTTYANRFEGIEGTLIEQDAELVEDLEKDFNVTLPKALTADTTTQRVDSIIASMEQKLERAAKLLEQARENRKDVF